MALAIVSALTDTARAKFADMLNVGRAFTITSFVTGEGGHDTSDPAVALTPDPANTTLPDQTFGPKAITSKSLISPYCVEYVCNLDLLEAVGELSNIGVIATVTYSPIIADPLVGSTFLFAIGNFPLHVKTDTETIEIRVTVNF